MPRVAKAAKQLLDLVGGTVVGDPDGFGVYRSVEVDAYAVRFDIDADRRVRGTAIVGGSLLVTFVAGTAADHTEPFDL